MRIMLACAYGMSTNMLVEKMKAAAKDKNYEIWAISKTEIANNMGKFDVLLLGPQIAYELDEVKTLLNGSVPVGVIQSMDYGMLNGANVVKNAEQLVEDFNK